MIKKVWLLLFLCLQQGRGEYAGQVPEGAALLFSVHQGNYATMINLDGEELWRNQEEVKHPQMLNTLPDGRLLIGGISGATIVNARGAVEWHHPVPKGAQNCMAIRVGEDRFLVGLEGPAKFQEIDLEGHVYYELNLKPTSDKVHGQFRYPSITCDGTYLVPLLASQLLHEYDRDGNVLWELEGRRFTHAVRLENGHTLVCSKGVLQEYDADKKLVWQFNLVADAQLDDKPIINVVQLGGGNRLMSIYQTDAAKPDILEVSPEKKIVHQWILPETGKVAHLSVVPKNDAFLKNVLSRSGKAEN